MEVEMEELDEEQGISYSLGITGFHLADHDYAISIQDIFPLKDLPVEIFCKILGLLKQNDKNNLRITCTWMKERLIQVDISLRKWNIQVNPETFQITLEVLSVGIAKLESVQTNPKISLCVIFSSKSLIKLGSVERSNIIKKLLGKFGRYVTRLDLTIHGDETYLLQDEYRLPNLVTFCVKSSPQKNDQGKFRYPSQKKCRIFEDLLVAYGRTLKTLGVEGLWSINFSGTKLYPLNSLETLNLSVSSSGTLQSLLSISGQFISTLELYRVLGNDKGELCYLQNLKHLSLDTRNMRFYDYVQRNTKNLESLVFYCDDPIKPSFPLRLKEFEKLKLLEVNCPVLNYAILQKCTQTLEYLYVPEKEMFVNWNELNLRLPIGLPNLKDLCVPGSERWSVEMIKKNCTSLEYLIIVGYRKLDAFLEGNEDMKDLSDEYDFHSFGIGIDDTDSNDDENDSYEEENNSIYEENDSNEANDFHDEKNYYYNEENDSNVEENDSNIEDNDSNDEENDCNVEENDCNVEENDCNVEENDSNNEENDLNDEENDSNNEENDSNEENNSNDEENNSNDGENDSNNKENVSNVEENDSNSEENDSNNEENVSNYEETDSNDEEYDYSDEEYDSYDGENDSNDQENYSNDDDIESMGLFNDHIEGPTEYSWPDLVAMNCRFPKLKMLLLPDCTETSIVESLAAKCPPDVKIITDRKLVGEAVKARITKDYSYSKYWRMIHPSLLELFKFN